MTEGPTEKALETNSVDTNRSDIRTSGKIEIKMFKWGCSKRWGVQQLARMKVSQSL